MLIAKSFPVTQVYIRAKSGDWIYKGHVINLPHNVQNIKNILPRSSNELPLAVFVAKDQNNKDLFFKVRCNRVWVSLL